MTRKREDVKKDVIDQLYWDTRVNAADVAVEIENGTAVLRGKVPSMLARRAAVEDVAAVQGVRAIENWLEVRYPAADPLPDDQIKVNVETALDWSPELDANRIDATVTTGVVTLSGTVDALWKKTLAEEIISNVSGVTGLVNDLVAAPTKDESDEEIAATLIAALQRYFLSFDDNIDLRVANGVVTLKGQVSSPAARQMVLDTASRTFGVTGVDDQLELAEDSVENNHDES
jgi:osmotically-inducible protein OsmY